MRVYQIWRVELDSFTFLQAGHLLEQIGQRRFKYSLSLVFVLRFNTKRKDDYCMYIVGLHVSFSLLLVRQP